MQGLAGLMNRHHERMGGSGSAAEVPQVPVQYMCSINKSQFPLIGLVRTPLLWLQDLWR